jgi:hypothetical protein
MSRSLVVLGLVSLATNVGISEASSPGIATYEIVSRISAPDGGWDGVNFDPVARRLVEDQAKIAVSACSP